MKDNRYLYSVALTATLLLLAFLICCSQEVPVNEPTDTTVEETIFDGLSSDSKAVINKLGEVSCIYKQDTSRFINGQILDNNYLDEDGDPVPVYFNSWLVEYNSVDSVFLSLFDKIEINTKLHNSNGYLIKELSEGKTYIEYCEYRFLNESETYKKDNLCFVELRLVCDEVFDDKPYAKSLMFDPSLKYEISKLNININTGEKITFDIGSCSITELARVFEYNEEGYLTTFTEYYASGAKNYETIFDGTYEQRWLSRTDYDESGNVTSTGVSEYNSDGYLTKCTWYYASGVKKRDYIYDGTSEERYLSIIFYNESGNVAGENEYNSDGHKSKFTEYYASGAKRGEIIYDGTSESNVLSITFYDEEGNVIS